MINICPFVSGYTKALLLYLYDVYLYATKLNGLVTGQSTKDVVRPYLIRLNIKFRNQSSNKGCEMEIASCPQSKLSDTFANDQEQQFDLGGT